MLIYVDMKSQNLTKNQTLNYINAKWIKYGQYKVYSKFILNKNILQHGTKKILIDKKFFVLCEKALVDEKWEYCVNFYDEDIIKGGITLISLEECDAMEKAFIHLKELVLKEKNYENDPFK